MLVVSLGLVVAPGFVGNRPQAAAVTYVLAVDEVRDLGTLPGHASSEAHAVNENGAIAGSSQTAAGVRRAVFWPSPTVAPVNLWHLGGGWSEATPTFFGDDGIFYKIFAQVQGIQVSE